MILSSKKKRSKRVSKAPCRKGGEKCKDQPARAGVAVFGEMDDKAWNDPDVWGVGKFTIYIPPKMWRDGEHSEVLIPLLTAYGPYMVDEYSSIPGVRLVPLGTKLDDELPSKKWVYEKGKITFEEHAKDNFAFKIL